MAVVIDQIDNDAHEEYEFTLEKGSSISLGVVRVDIIVDEKNSNSPKVEFDTKVDLTTGDYTFYEFK